MNKKQQKTNVSILTDPAIGGTFLCWSLYYLAGQNDYYLFKEFTRHKLPDSPLTNTNAHAFTPNQMSHQSDAGIFERQKKEIDGSSAFNIFYMHPNGNPFLDNSHHETSYCIQYLSKLSDKKIVVSIPSEHHFYHQSYKARVLCGKLCDPATRSKSESEQHDDFINYYFPNSKKQWEQQNLSDVWDHREFLALNLRPYEEVKIQDFDIGVDKQVMYIDARDLWYSLDMSIKNIFDWLELEFDNERYTQWTACYNQWRSFHYNRVSFGWYFNEIVYAIVKGTYINLERFDLDIVQEAIIQHELIYKYNLNLKTYNLTKFVDTIQLNNLLEENFHPISDIYNIQSKKRV